MGLNKEFNMLIGKYQYNIWINLVSTTIKFSFDEEIDFLKERNNSNKTNNEIKKRIIIETKEVIMKPSLSEKIKINIPK